MQSNTVAQPLHVTFVKSPNVPVTKDAASSLAISGRTQNNSSKLPLSPVCPSGDLQTQDSSQGDESLGESVILEIPDPNGEGNIQLVINSVLCFTSKCLADKQRSELIIKMLSKEYTKDIISQAWSLCRSLLQKQDRPKRSDTIVNNIESIHTTNAIKTFYWLLTN